ncbi:baseplate protein, partial [Escherichia coli]
ITAEMIAKYEADTGKTLYPAQAERLLIDLWAYREMLVRVAVQVDVTLTSSNPAFSTTSVSVAKITLSEALTRVPAGISTSMA